MKWQKSPSELIKLFDTVVPGAPVVRRTMFGYPAAFVNGDMFMGLHQNNMVLRLSDEARTDFLKQGATIFEPMPSRPMREYVAVPPQLLTDLPNLSVWIEKALKFRLSLKAKAKRSSQSKGAKSSGPAKQKKEVASDSVQARAFRRGIMPWIISEFY